MPFLTWRYGPSASPIFPVQRGILAFRDPQLIGESRLSQRGQALSGQGAGGEVADHLGLVGPVGHLVGLEAERAGPAHVWLSGLRDLLHLALSPPSLGVTLVRRDGRQ